MNEIERIITENIIPMASASSLAWIENVEETAKAISQYVIKARIETLEELIIDVDKLPFNVNEKVKAIYEGMNERYRLRIAKLKKELQTK